MSIKNFCTERIISPLNDCINGLTVSSNLKFLKKSEFWSKNKLEDFQLMRLKILLQQAYENVPYYQDLFNKLKIKPSDIQKRNDLALFPILKKDTIRNEGLDRFTAININKKKCLLRSSSGSTGEPLFYWSTKEAYSMNIAANLRGWYTMGYRLGDRYVKLSQNPRKNLIKRLQDKLSNNLYIATNPLNYSNYHKILSQLEKFKPKVIRCYPDPLLFLAQYKKLHREFTFAPHAINTTGNTLFPETRLEIESAFNCKIFDSYNCEGNSLVFECPTHTCYHSTEEYGISEVLDANNKPIENGIGHLISTDLWNLVHPFIRYDTQDLVEINSENCPCGRNHMKILRILGRDNDILVMPSGRRFIVHNFTGFFQVDSPQIQRSIEQFQIVQKRDSAVEFRLVVNEKFNESVADYIKSFWEKELKVHVMIETVKKIPLLKTGKHKFIIRED